MMSGAPLPEKISPELVINLEAATTFIELLGAAKATFQTFDDGSQKDGRLARILHGSLAEHATELSKLNCKGAGVFVTINKTDGKGRKRQNIVAVRALMLDLDGAPLAPVLTCKLRPHVIVETSQGHYQVYWRVAGLSLESFEDVQRSVAKRFDGDPSVALLTQCGRIPGFFHNKNEPFQTRIVETN